MFKSYFQEFQILLLVGAGLSLILSLALFRKKYSFGLLLLCVTGFLIFLFGATLDDYLNLWDERFHALVAKNLMNDPLKPTLYKIPILDIEYDYWALAHVWMHKQPLFLWQSAISFHLFGISAINFRLPSVLLSSFMVLAIYRSTKLLINRSTAYLSALLFISSFFFLQLISGRQGLDQNDITFTAYISFSIWSLIEYQQSKNKIWLVLIGLFSGFAVLTKWLVGLLVYLVWASYVYFKKEFYQVKEILHSLFLTCIIFVPWQLYCYINYKEEYLKELNYSSEHFFNAVEGHSGDVFYYFDFFSSIYGSAMGGVFLLGIILIIRRKQNLEMIKALLFSTAFVYLFFTLAQTKMEGYTAINVLFVFMIIGYTLSFIVEYLEKKINVSGIRKVVFPLAVITIILFRFDIEKIQENHTNWKGGSSIYKIQTNNKNMLEELELRENEILFNIPYYHYVDAMFYTNNIAYSFLPSQEQLKEIEKKGYKALIFKNKIEEFEKYIVASPTVTIIEKSFY